MELVCSIAHENAEEIEKMMSAGFKISGQRTALSPPDRNMHHVEVLSDYNWSQSKYTFRESAFMTRP